MTRPGSILIMTCLLSISPSFAQTGSLLYDIGIMIDDSSKIQQDTLQQPGAASELTREQQLLEEELNRYQQQLAETEVRLKYQTGVIDSLQTEIAQIKAAGETDRALLSTRINTLVDQQTKAGESPVFTPGDSQVSDSVYAELNTPWETVPLNTHAARPVVTGPRLTRSEEQAAYRKGLTKFHQQYYYQAIDEFNTIINRGVDVTMRANAQYWVGRCYYDKGLYDDAIRALEQVQRFKNSDKLDDALVMIGLAFKNKNRLPEAKLAFQELVLHHPGSEYLTLAKRFVQE